MSDGAVTLLLVDDHPLYHAGLMSVLTSLKPNYRLLSAGDCTGGLAMLRDNPGIDLVLVDIVLPGKDGFEAVAEYGRSVPHVPRVLISGREDKSTFVRATRSGASGFVSKAWPIERIVALIERVLAGGTGFESAEHPIVNGGSGRKQDLTLRQIEVLCLLSEGKSNKEIAHALDIAERTVRAHLTELFHALSVGTRMNAVLKAQQLGIVP